MRVRRRDEKDSRDKDRSHGNCNRGFAVAQPARLFRHGAAVGHGGFGGEIAETRTARVTVAGGDQPSRAGGKSGRCRGEQKQQHGGTGDEPTRSQHVPMVLHMPRWRIFQPNPSLGRRRLVMRTRWSVGLRPGQPLTIT